MRSPGLSAADLKLYHAALAASHSLSVEVRILDLAGKHITSVKPTVNSGQVDMDVDRDVTRTATLSFNDPNRSLQFDPDSPNDSAMYFNRMVQIRYGIQVAALGRRVWAPVFTGPLVKFDRTGDEISLEAQGKESFALNGCPTMTFKRGKNAVDAIHDILYERCGERRFAFPSLGNRLPKDVVVGRAEEVRPWVVCKQIAHSLGLHLFYDGAGICHLRHEPGSPVFRFHTGEDSNITSLVQVSHDKSLIKNRVVVVGSKPAHKATVTLTHSPFSPQSLAVNGVPQYLYADDINDHKIRSAAAARRRGEAVLAKYASMTFGNTFSALPVPHLDELDMVRIVTDEYVGRERLRQWSFPLAGGDMTVGYNDLVARPRRNVRKA